MAKHLLKRYRSYWLLTNFRKKGKKIYNLIE